MIFQLPSTENFFGIFFTELIIKKTCALASPKREMNIYQSRYCMNSIIYSIYIIILLCIRF